MNMSVFDDVLSCTKEEVAEQVQKYQSFEKRIESYKEWIETLDKEFEDKEFIPILPGDYSDGYLCTKLYVKCLGKGVGVKFNIRIKTNELNQIYSYIIEHELITYPSKQKANMSVMRLHEPNLIKLGKVFEKIYGSYKIPAQDFEYYDLPKLVTTMKRLEKSVKEESLAMAETFLDEIRTEIALREITDC